MVLKSDPGKHVLMMGKNSKIRKQIMLGLIFNKVINVLSSVNLLFIRLNHLLEEILDQINHKNHQNCHPLVSISLF